jgi:Spy/CpxP family protein refolding chaperone
MRGIWILVLALVVIPGGLVAQGRGPDRDRREVLERQVRTQFMAQVAQRLELTGDQRERVRETLEQGAVARRDLALESRSVRMDLMQAVREEDAPMSRFEAILDRLRYIRELEREIESREEAALAEILNPRQRAMFLMMRMQFNERIRQMRGAGPGEGPGHQGGPPGAGPPRV